MKRYIRGKEHVLVVGKVEERDFFGRPMTVRIIYDEETTKIEGGEAFILIWVQEHNTRKGDEA